MAVGVDTTAWWEFPPGTRVMTREGFPGVVALVEDGPVAGNEEYIVTLDNDMGGGRYSSSELRPLNQAQAQTASTEHTAADDYPELGDILVRRPNHQTVIPFGPRTASLVPVDAAGPVDWQAMHAQFWCDACGWQGVLEPTVQNGGSKVDICPQCGAVTPYEEVDDTGLPVAAKLAATYYVDTPESLALQDEASMALSAANDAMLPVEVPDGSLEDGTAREIALAQVGEVGLHEQRESRAEDIRVKTGGFLDFLMGSPEPSKTWAGPGQNWSYDWCRFRRNSQCYYPKDLNVEASKTAGYAVWNPELRGHCPRVKWTDQQACPVGEPGPHAPNGMTDATRSWDEGGQRDGFPGPEIDLSHATKPVPAAKPWLAPVHSAVEEEAAAEPCGHYVESSEIPKTCGNCFWAWGAHSAKAGGPTGHGPDALHPTGAVHSALSSIANWDSEIGFHMTAAWADVRAKAKEIAKSGGVRILSAPGNSNISVTAEVRGDTHVYMTSIIKQPGRHAIAMWECGCAWGAYAWGRTGRWKRYEGRMCSHALAVNYEAQRRGMFGGEVREDREPARWKDPTIPVKWPGDWDRDKGRYSSLRVTASFADAEPPPAVEFVKAALGEGVPPNDCLRMLVAMQAPVPGALLALALGGSFMAKVRGVITKVLLTAEGLIANGQPVDPHEVVYPTYDPRLGLSLADRRLAALIREAAGSDFGAAARALIALSKKKEPGVTSALQGLAKQTGGSLEGLDHRLKSEQSLVRKMTDEAADYGNDAGRAAANMSDALRYTMTLSPDRYAEGAKTVLGQLQSQGYKARVKNFWERGDAYNGINAAMRTPDGHPFELQFHTPQSLHVKQQQVHPLYEQYRVSKDPKARYDTYKKMQGIFDTVDVPKDVFGVKDLKRQEWPKAAAATGNVEVRHHHITDHDGEPVSVMRTTFDHDKGEMHVHVKRRDGSDWTDAPEYGRYLINGEPSSDEADDDSLAATARNEDDPCTACGGTGEQGTGHECYICDGTGMGEEERTTANRDNSNPENGLLVGLDLANGQQPVLAAGHPPVNCPAPEHYDGDGLNPALWDEGNGYQHHDGSVSHNKSSRSVSDWINNPHEAVGSVEPFPLIETLTGPVEGDPAPVPAEMAEALGLTQARYLTIEDAVAAAGNPTPEEARASINQAYRDQGDEWLFHDGAPLAYTEGHRTRGDEGFEHQTGDETVKDYERHLLHQHMPGTHKKYPYDKPWYDKSRWGPHGFVEIAAAPGGGAQVVPFHPWLLNDADLGELADILLADEGTPAGLLPGEPTYDVPPFAVAGPNGPIADLHEEPEPALPTTDGTEEGPQTDADAMALGLADDVTEAREDLGLPPVQHDDGADILRRHQAAMEAGTPEASPLAHLAGGKDPAQDSDIAAAAQEFLAKEGLKSFTPGERKALIDEGLAEGVTAANLDRLDIAGTHYEALEMTSTAALDPAEDEDTANFMMWG